MTKWHYLNENDDMCKRGKDSTVFPSGLATACNRDPLTMKRHTEEKSQVDCLVCLNMINQYNYDKGYTK